MSGLTEYATFAHELGDSGTAEGPLGITQVKVAFGSPRRDVAAACRLAGALRFLERNPWLYSQAASPLPGKAVAAFDSYLLG